MKEGALTLGLLMTFSTLIGYAVMPVKEIIEMQPVIQKAIVAADRLNDVLEGRDEDTAAGGSVSCGGDIKMSNATFCYGNRDAVLSGLTLHIKAGEKAAVVGKSGSGKTTLAKLLLKLESLEEGDILIDGKNIKNLSTDCIRKKIAYVQQDTFLFSDTIRKNLICQNDGVSEEELTEVCKICQIYDFIQHLPNGFDERIDEGGSNLSGGQKQRFAIARALLRKPRILILDEATSHLDKANERNINKIIFDQCENMTCILITHNVSVLEKCDRIFVLEDGKAVEDAHEKF